MEMIRSIVARYPQHEFRICRRCAQDPHFQSICADYEEAATALRKWQKAAGDSDRMVAEYASFVGELEAEILEQLNRSMSSA
jgi:hypothetical protein